MNQKVKKEDWICPICNKKYIISINKRKECKICNKFLKVGYKESEVLRKINEHEEIKQKTQLIENITENNPTYKFFWLQRNYSDKETERQIKIRNAHCIEYWIDRGYTETESTIKLNEHLNNSVKERIDFWLKRGYTKEIAKSKVEDQKKWRSIHNKKNYQHKNNILRKEYWINKGFSEKESLIKIKETQYKRFKHLTKENYSNTAIKRNKDLKLNKEKYNNYIKKTKTNGYKIKLVSPVFKEYWINKGYSLEESQQKVRDIKFINQDGYHLSSKIEINCINELKDFLNILIETGKFRYIEKQYFCYDGKYKNFIIEFNGTKFHLDERFYNINDKTPYGKTYTEVKNNDNIKINKTLLKYNVIIIWEYDYLNKKDLIFNNIKQFIKENENNKKGKYWNSASI